jgi:hypothetical protein
MGQAMSAAQQAAMQAQQNYQARANLIATGLYMTKQLQAVTGGLGQQIRVPLDRMGIMTGVTLRIDIPVTIGATATPSPFGPYNSVQQITYVDYSGLQRVITSGFQLHALNNFRGGKVLNNAQDYAFLPTSEAGIDTNILNVPTAVGNGVVTFYLYVPIAYDPASDLRGAVLSQTIYGDHYITIQLPAALVSADTYAAPYSAGTVTLNGQNTVSITAFQDYIMPQQGVANLPMIDLSTIYSIEGGTTDSANITSGQSKYLNWPNNRAILSAIHVFDNGGAGTLNGADVNRIILLGNSNTNIRELTPSLLRQRQRYMLGTDMPSGTYYMSSRSQPITTQLYGNVQTQFDIITANANAYFSSQYEGFYLSGTPLPGVIQG